MSRLLEYYLYSQLKVMGWPKRKGFLRTQYVDAALADVVIGQGLQVIVGLGAGRPEVAVGMLADTFSGNPWTKESTSSLFESLREAREIAANYPDIPPWQALWRKHQLASYSKEWGWSDLFDDTVGMIRSMAASRAAYWGLTNEQEMQALFDREKSAYEKSAIEGNQYGLGVSYEYPFQSLEQFYQWCDTIVHGFKEALPPFPEIPPSLSAVPDIARRLPQK